MARGFRMSRGWYKRIAIDSHHVLMLLLTIPTILSSILLAGCTVESMKDFHILSFSYTNASSSMSALAGSGTALQIRVGYFGYCLLASNKTTYCSTDAASLATLVQDVGSSDPLNLLDVARQFHDGTIFSGLIFIGLILGVVCQILLAAYPNWHTEGGSDGSEREFKPFPDRSLSRAALISIAVASFMALIAALWQHLSSAATSAMAGALTSGAVSGEVGAAAMTLGWVSTAVLFLVLIVLLVTTLYIRVLEVLVGNSQ